MAAQTTSKKRKSADGSAAAVKKVKTVRSAEQPAPLKSALKKAKPQSRRSVPEEAPTQDVDGVETSMLKGPTVPVTDLTPDQTTALLAGFSSDEDDGSENEAGIAVAKLPKAPAITAIQNVNGQTNSNDPENTPGVIYVGRIPHGFYEHQMRAYFSQFGVITNLRLMRNRKTGNSQHHGFIEFASAAVADIVCKTMDKYLLFGHILQVRRVPKDQVNEKLWERSSRQARHPVPRNKLEGSKLRRGATREVWEARIGREEKKRKEKAGKLKEMGYEFEMPEVKAVDEVPKKQKVIQDAGSVDKTGTDDSVTMEKAGTTENGNAVRDVVAKKKRPAAGKTEVKKVVKKAKV